MEGKKTVGSFIGDLTTELLAGWRREKLDLFQRLHDFFLPSLKPSFLKTTSLARSWDLYKRNRGGQETRFESKGIFGNFTSLSSFFAPSNEIFILREYFKLQRMKRGREEGKAGDFTTRAFPPPPSNDPINHHLSKRAPQIESCSRLITISPTSEKIKASVSGILGSWKGSFPFLFVSQYRVKFIPLLSTSNYASSSRESAILLREYSRYIEHCVFSLTRILNEDRSSRN